MGRLVAPVAMGHPVRHTAAMDLLTTCLTALKQCHQSPSDRTIWRAEFELRAYVRYAGDSAEARSEAVDALEGAWRAVDPNFSSILVADFIEKWRRKLGVRSKG